MFSAVALPSFIFFVGALLLPESPRWLAANREGEQARRTLTRIGGSRYADQELLNIQETVASSGAGTWQGLLRPSVFKIVVIGVVLAALQQWVGINVMFNYADEIYRSAGYGVSDTLLNIVATGVIGLLATFAAFPLVDRVGRRPLMLLGCVGVGLFHVISVSLTTLALKVRCHLPLPGEP